MTAVRNSLLRSIRERVNELPGLIDALDMETLPETGADTYHRALDSLVAAVREACGFDMGEISPEDAPWAVTLGRLDNACTEIVDGLVAKGLWG